ncbi:MAG: fucose isomerase [Phycisphaeraceae bacterium]|nr:MAG: fucose isomerase [Phycisphaeraceae bacterium]
MSRTASSVPSRTALLIASGDLRESANRICWPAQKQLEDDAAAAFKALGWKLKRAHAFDPDRGHGFIASQAEGRAVFEKIDPGAPLVVAEAVWQYSHHVLIGLARHRGPILILANWSGQWPGLVGALNLRGSLTKAGVKYSLLWGEDFADPAFRAKLKQWTTRGRIAHDLSHVQPLNPKRLSKRARDLGEKLAGQLRRRPAILGVFDEGCMGMFNAIIPDHLLNPCGAFKERLSQSTLYHAMTQVPEEEARAVRAWLDEKGMRFITGPNEETDLTERQILDQCRMYIAALRIADEFGCDAIGIQYQQGLKDLAPASDLVEGLLNDSVRPPVRNARGEIIRDGAPMTHFNEVDECAGLDGLITDRVWAALKQPRENTLHDLRWGDWWHGWHDAPHRELDSHNAERRATQGGTYVWVFEISGAAPASHFPRGWADAVGERQPPMYFRLGGSTVKGISRPGEIVWSRIYVADDALHMDIGRAQAIELPREETERRWQATTPQWPIMHAVLYGVSRDQMMAKHQANHIQVAYATSPAKADLLLAAKAAMAHAMGIQVNLCGTDKSGRPLSETIRAA